MAMTTGVIGKFFSALGSRKINVLATAQGCSERNISAVIKQSDATAALQAVHSEFHLSHSILKVAIVCEDERATSERSEPVKHLSMVAGSFRSQLASRQLVYFHS